LPSVTAVASGGRVTLTGSVPSQEAVDALVAAAAARYGEANVVSQLTVDETLSPTGLTEFGLLIGALGPQDAATAALADGRLALSGTVGSEAVKGAVEQAAAAVTGDAARVTSQLTVGAAAGGGTGSSALTGDKATVQAALDRLPRITFQTGSAALTAQGWQGVQQAAQVLKVNPEIKVRVQGHADDVGNAASNQQLSTTRASTVREALHSLGIDHERMSFIGYGETRPLVPNTSEANRLINRRAQLQVL
jgi:outer membrane protein OmpA-like peptidoglycan-associated protein